MPEPNSSSNAIPMSAARTILLHVWSTFLDEEVPVWRQLGRELESRGFQLVLTGTTKPPADLEVPFYFVPYGYFVAHGLAEIGASVRKYMKKHPRDVLASIPIQMEELLLRERQWRERDPSDEDRANWEFGFGFYAAVYSALLLHLRPRLVVVWNGYHPGEIILRALADRAACPTAFVERGPFPRTLYFDPDGILGDSSVVREPSMRLPGDEAARGKDAFESTRRMVQEGGLTWWRQAEAAGSAAVRSKLGVPADRPVILFAEQLEADTQSFAFSPLFARPAAAFEWLNARLADRTDLFLLGKSHPHSRKPAADWEKLRRVPGCWATDVNLFDALQVATHVAAVNSTVLYEGMLAGKPTLSMGDGLFSGRDFFYEVRSTSDSGVVQSWLRGDGFADRVTRFEEFCAFLLRRSLYAYPPPVNVDYPGLGCADLADAMVRRATDTELDYRETAATGALDSMARIAAEWPMRDLQVEAALAAENAKFGRLGQLLLQMKATRAWAAGRGAWNAVTGSLRSVRT